ncbi:sn-glycerol-3-phosphate ABC transporter ATP-binding protein UgpC [Rhizobium lusitanum]|uniref:sn-glycerol-3-phosphate ABC transporter ATP-binding protein UgpC n=1 Tax=Rhizobium lusitanum TaxID=293958 RepID=A0A6L9UEK3_9HYPH|nr:sn-glycerol-3-phosphate ABC transporter ATP-binding protein UgpC [Rhizobium lusitanum]NEI72567.1 sn-glycerol-3-phosphate ABC transporter ATP-binding protein UgpC [Rhizobium lusitanum]
MAAIALEKVVKAYNTFQVVHSIDLEIRDHEFMVLVGPSGCGKSTTLRMIAGLESISGGEIRIDGRRVNELLPGERDIAMVFQNYALYPHLSVEDNITFGLRLRKAGKAEIEKRLAETARILDIEALLKRKPRQLSGGQRQRVAMGRAMIRNPSVFLFDEPLSNLDAKLRVQMRAEIKQLHEIMPTTTVYVTHDQVEAMTLADRVVVMNGGHIEQVAAPQELYLKPASKFVAGFIGSPGMNFFKARMLEEDGGTFAVLDNDARIPINRGIADLTGRDIEIGIRPEHFSIGASMAPDAVAMEAEAGLIEPLGMDMLVHLTLAGSKIVVRAPPNLALRRGDKLGLFVDPANVYVFDQDGRATYIG